MNRRLILSLFLLGSTLGLSQVAHAQDSVVLCSAPLDPDCVDPRWGMVEPDGLVGDATGDAARAQAAASLPGRIAARLMPAAMRSAKATGAASLTARVDATRLFERQTAALTAAIKSARFDRNSKIVRGADKIAAAAEGARKAGSKYELVLYIKAPAKLGSAQSTLLNNKLAAINEVLAAPSAPRS